MRYALVGCGRISVNHIQAALNNNLEIVALCDTDTNVINEKISIFGLNNIKKYNDYHELISNERLDLIAIATESGKHAQIAIDCIRAGINIIIEKPIALSLEDANRIISESQKAGVIVSVNHQNRFNKAIKKIRENLDNGAFGKIFYGTAHIRWNRNESYYSKADWRGTWAQDGGALMNQCIHNIDLLQWMLGGNVDTVFGFTDNLNHNYIEAEDLGIAVLKFKNGAYGIIEGTTDVYPQNLEETLYIFGENGTVKAGGNSVNRIEEWHFKNSTDKEEDIIEIFKENPPNVYGFGHTPLYEDVIDSIINKREPLVTAIEGKKALEIVLAIYKSSLDGVPVKLPLDECCTTDFNSLSKRWQYDSI